MPTIAFALLLAAPVLAQPAPATPAAPPVSPAAVSPAADAITPEARAVLDRAVAAYRGAKGYRESVLTTLRQKATGTPKGSEPPAEQASSTSFLWGGPERFVFNNRDFALFRNGSEATILFKANGEYTQREMKEEDKPVFANMVDTDPVYQALVGGTGAPGKPVFGRFVSADKVAAEELRGVKGKRVSGAGFPPLTGFDVTCPVTMFFADDTGLLLQATYDLKSAMQALADSNLGGGDAQGTQANPRFVIEQFTITRDSTEAKLDPQEPESAFTFKPSETDRKVESFTMAVTGEKSVQRTLLNKAAPDFTATTLDGKPWSLKDQRGKVVLLQFWASSEQRSTASLATFNSLDMQMRPAGVVIVGVNQDHAAVLEQTRRIVQEKQAAGYPTLADVNKEIGNAYRVGRLPCTILIDKEGVVRSISNDLGSPDPVAITGRLDKLLKGEPIADTPEKH